MLWTVFHNNYQLCWTVLNRILSIYYYRNFETHFVTIVLYCAYDVLFSFLMLRPWQHFCTWCIYTREVKHSMTQQCLESVLWTVCVIPWGLQRIQSLLVYVARNVLDVFGVKLLSSNWINGQLACEVQNQPSVFSGTHCSRFKMASFVVLKVMSVKTNYQRSLYRW